jgi:ATP-dependent exoDNAse (exonuclease V) beta subunit
VNDPGLNDHHQRREAIRAEWHAFVWASAGTGKTHTLTLRALYLLINAPFLDSAGAFPGLTELYGSDEPARLRAARTAIHSLVLTTFTRKASAEMQTRLYELLDSLASARDWTEVRERYGRVNPLLLELCETVEGNIRRSCPEQACFTRFQSGVRALADLAPELQISTLHSFATAILRRHPLYSGVAPGTRFAREDEDDFEDVPAQVVRCWWRQEAVEGSELQRDLVRVLEVATLDQVQNWLAVACQHPWIAERMDLDTEFCSDAMRRRLLAASQRLADGLEKLKTSSVSRNRESLKEAIRNVQAGTDSAWSGFYQSVKDTPKLFLDCRDTPNSVRDTIADLPAEDAFFFQERFRFLAVIMACVLSFEYRENWEAWKRVVRAFSRWSSQAANRELGILTFDAMIESAVRLLEQNVVVRRAESSRLRALLVDEFQDTDALQLRLLTALLSRDAKTGHEPLGFFVGDRKQSIYRFRGADPPAVDGFCSRYHSLTQARLEKREYQLSTTFRCQPSIARFVNHFFTDEIELAERGEWLNSALQGDESLAEWICIEPLVTTGKLPAGRIRKLAACQVAQLIEDHRAKGRPLSDVLILVRTFAELDVVLPVLQSAGIPAVSSGARTFYRQPEVLDVVNLLIALLNPLDSLAAATVLRSPCLGLSDPQIYNLFRALPPERVFHGTAELPDCLPEAARTRILQMRRIVQQRRTLTLADWLRSVRSLLPLHLYVKESDKEGRALYRIERVFELLQAELEEGTRAPLPWLLNQRMKVSNIREWDANLGEDVSIADETVEAVRIMTIHKAKGLEGRFVIVYNWMDVLSEIERSKKADRPSAVSGTGEDGNPVREFCLEWGPFSVSSPGYHQALEANERSRRREAMRLAYVAATRARSRLALVCPPAKGGPAKVASLLEQMRCTSQPDCDGRCSAIHEKGFRFWFQNQAEEPILRPPIEENWTPAKREEYHRIWRERFDGFRKSAPGLLQNPSRSEEVRRSEESSPDHLLEAGRLVHSYLERHLLKREFEPAKLRDMLAGLGESPSAEALRLSSVVLSRFYAGDPSPSRYQARLGSGRVLGQEIPFFLFFEGRSWNGVIDLVLEEDGVIRGIDYKISSEVSPLPETYARQKRVYFEAVRRLFPGNKVDFEFWWLS